MPNPYFPDQSDLSVRPQKLGPNTESNLILDLAPVPKPTLPIASSGEPESGRGVPPLALTLSDCFPPVPISRASPEWSLSEWSLSEWSQSGRTKNRGPKVEYSRIFPKFYPQTINSQPVTILTFRGPTADQLQKTPGHRPSAAGQCPCGSTKVKGASRLCVPFLHISCLQSPSGRRQSGKSPSGRTLFRLP